MNKSKLPISWLSNLIIRSKTLNPKSPIFNHNRNRFLHNSSNPIKFTRISPYPTRNLTQIRHFFEEHEEDQALKELYDDIEKEEHREREAKRKAGVVINDVETEEEDYLGVTPLIDQIDKVLNNPYSKPDVDESTDSDSELEEEKDVVYMEQERKGALMFDRLCKRHEELMRSFSSSTTLDGAFNAMTKINKFEEKHFRLLPEYRVIGDLMNRFKGATGKEKFILAQKLNRAMKLVEYREEFNPDDSANYRLMQNQQFAAIAEDDDDKHKRKDDGEDEDDEKLVPDDDEEEFDDMKERDDMLLEKVNSIDKKLEKKLAELDFTFGKKGKVLESEIRDLAEERNALTNKKNIPMHRKGFDTKVIDINRTCKVTKGGQVAKYTAIIACGNYQGVVGYAKAKGPKVPIAIQKAKDKCFQNLHYIDRYEGHTIAHAVQTTYKKTKVYFWPASTATGVKAGKTVAPILQLAGFKNLKSKVIGSRNPHNIVKAVFQALNAVETPKDVQEKFGRTVVETHLL